MTASWLADKIEQWPTTKLLPYARNARTHSDDQVMQIAASIAEFGFTNPILAGADGVIVAGHGRLAAANKLGLSMVPVVVLDHLSATQRRALVIADNRIAENAGWDDAMLRVELEALQDDEFDLSITGFDLDDLADLQVDEDGDGSGSDQDDLVPEASETVISQPGDVWLLGKHRLLCGDSTLANSYTQLLLGETVDLVFTDPPYNVNYANSAKDKLRGKNRAILNDNLGDGFYDFLLAALTPTLAHCRGAIYIAMSSSELDVLQEAFRAAGGHWSTFIIWAKNTFTLGRADYQRQYEPILYGWPEGVQRHWCGDRDQGDVWQINKPAKNDLHPTMKPVELVERAIRNSSKPGQVVLDPFGGSGTTLIAAEKAGRVARLIELDPKYVDVIVRRWQDWTGQQATREADGVAFDSIPVLGPIGHEVAATDVGDVTEVLEFASLVSDVNTADALQGDAVLAGEFS
jgi:DNA modification methylase